MCLFYRSHLGLKCAAQSEIHINYPYSFIFFQIKLIFFTLRQGLKFSDTTLFYSPVSLLRRWCSAMLPKPLSPLFPWLILLTLVSLFSFYSFISLYRPSSSSRSLAVSVSPSCNYFRGKWVLDPNHKPLYDETCPFHRNAWNCLRNKRENMTLINSWKWVPQGCDLPRIDPVRFLGVIRNKNVGFIGDSLNENFLTSFLCILRIADEGAKKWKKKGAWRGAYFPKFNVRVGYHRAVLLSKYQ